MATRWLFKTEPSVYSYQQLVKDKKTMWDGVKNNLALKNLKDIKKGDEILIYHTGDEKAAVGDGTRFGRGLSRPEPEKSPDVGRRYRSGEDVAAAGDPGRSQGQQKISQF